MCDAYLPKKWLHSFKGKDMIFKNNFTPKPTIYDFKATLSIVLKSVTQFNMQINILHLFLVVETLCLCSVF